MSPLTDEASLNARVSVLEDWRREHREWMIENRAGMTQINTTMLGLKLCATPNACGSLKKELEDRTVEIKDAMARIESLEKWRVFLNGAMVALGGVWLVMQVIVPWILKALENVPAT